MINTKENILITKVLDSILIEFNKKCLSQKYNGIRNIWKFTQCWQRGLFAKQLGLRKKANRVGTYNFRHSLGFIDSLSEKSESVGKHVVKVFTVQISDSSIICRIRRLFVKEVQTQALQNSRLVQSVEHRNLTPDVGGSNPSTAAK